MSEEVKQDAHVYWNLPNLGAPVQIDQIAAALVKAQGAFPVVPKTGTNPHLQNRYATLDDIIGAIRGPLAENGLAFVQLLENDGQGAFALSTILIHESGQRLESRVSVRATGESRGINALQALGSSITYMKRYALSAMLGIATGEDTDGEGGGGEGGGEGQKRQPQRRQPQRRQAAPKKEPVPKKEPAEEGGDGDGAEADIPTITSPKELFAAVNDVLPYYNSVGHCLKTLQKVQDPSFTWNTAGINYKDLYGLLVDYARANQA